jgi:hypothetical protein
LAFSDARNRTKYARAWPADMRTRLQTVDTQTRATSLLLGAHRIATDGLVPSNGEPAPTSAQPSTKHDNRSHFGVFGPYLSATDAVDSPSSPLSRVPIARRQRLGSPMRGKRRWLRAEARSSLAPLRSNVGVYARRRASETRGSESHERRTPCAARRPACAHGTQGNARNLDEACLRASPNINTEKQPRSCPLGCRSAQSARQDMDLSVCARLTARGVQPSIATSGTVCTSVSSPCSISSRSPNARSTSATSRPACSLGSSSPASTRCASRLA